MPPWVNLAVNEYLKRMQSPYQVTIKALPATPRKNNTPAYASEQEGKLILQNIPNQSTPIALCVEGKSPDSLTFAKQIEMWVDQSKPPCFIIGGADGLAPSVIRACSEQLSLSKLTLPHSLARIMLSEQLYRAMSLINGHPYHKGGGLHV